MQLRFSGPTTSNSNIDARPLAARTAAMLKSSLLLEEELSCAEHLYALLTHERVTPYRHKFVELNILAVLYMLTTVGINSLVVDIWDLTLQEHDPRAGTRKHQYKATDAT